jgi:hypothetical protein
MYDEPVRKQEPSRYHQAKQRGKAYVQKYQTAV